MAVARPVLPVVTNPTALLARVVDHYHRSFCQRPDAQEYLEKRGLTDAEMLRAFKVGYADGSLLKLVGKSGELWDALRALGIITEKGAELLGGCVVVPIPDPKTGEWATLYGRGMRTPRHCYLNGPLRGVLNYQAARSSSEIILTESVIDALSFQQAGVSTAIPIYGTNGFTDDHMDLLTSERVKRVVLALDGDAAGREATKKLKEKLTTAGITVRVMPYPPNVKDSNELLVDAKSKAPEVFAKCLADAEPVPALAKAPVLVAPAREPAPAAKPAPTPAREEGVIVLDRDGRSYQARVVSNALGRLRATIKVARESVFHVDTIDLYSSRSRTEFARRASKILSAGVAAIESDLMAVLLQAEKAAAVDAQKAIEPTASEMTESERAEAHALLKKPDLLDQVARDVDALGYVGENTNVRLLYLVAVSRKLLDPMSAVILSQSSAGKSVASEVIEKLTPPEDVVLVTRLTPQSLYYVEPGALDHKLIIIEERHGSAEADYSVRVLQSRKKLSVMAPIKDPASGNMKTKQFEVEARAAFVEATTSTDIHHENSTRCFELTIDESTEQTRRIHERQRLMWTEAGLKLRAEADQIARRHWNAQRILEPLPVVIPYADKLTFPASWLRTRRDNARFLNLIGVSAFLHQYQRERTSGAVVATIADYETAYRLASHLLTETLSDLKAPLRRALERIRALADQSGGTVSRREIREALAEPDSTVRRWLAELVELEYLEAESSRGGAGKTTRYSLTPRGPQDDRLDGLLTPEQLRKLSK